MPCLSGPCDKPVPLSQTSLPPLIAKGNIPFRGFYPAWLAASRTGLRYLSLFSMAGEVGRFGCPGFDIRFARFLGCCCYLHTHITLHWYLRLVRTVITYHRLCSNDTAVNCLLFCCHSDIQVTKNVVLVVTSSKSKMITKMIWLAGVKKHCFPQAIFRKTYNQLSILYKMIVKMMSCSMLHNVCARLILNCRQMWQETITIYFLQDTKDDTEKNHL